MPEGGRAGKKARRGKIAPRSAPRENSSEFGLETPPRSRVVLLGASNLTLAFPRVIARLCEILPVPLDVLAAIGHGRSYGRPSRVLFRELPGVVECGLWRALETGPERDTRAFLTDFGNDLVYGAGVDEIAEWIALILRRLAARGARATLVRLPLTSIERLSPLRFSLARGIFYPSHRIDLATIRARASALDARIRSLAVEHGATLIEPRADWYGLDPIHILRAKRDEAWNALLAPLAERKAPAGSTRLRGPDRREIARMRPERRRWMGREETRPQPCARLLDGTVLSSY
jgi:hypothetical protein